MGTLQNKIAWQKTPLKITGIQRTNDRIVEVILEDGRPVPIRRDLIEIFGDTAYVPIWLASKIKSPKK